MKNKLIIILVFFALIFCLLGTTFSQNPVNNKMNFSNDSSDFVVLTDVVPDVILEIRYFSTYNFVVDRIYGYEQPTPLLTKEAANALKEVSDELIQRGYYLKIYDAYRPQKAVDNFVNWSKDPSDSRMKYAFYPDLDKSVLFDQGYISNSSGHTREVLWI